jgi:hypothetical protein
MAKKKGFLSRILDKFDKKLEKQAKNKECCCCESGSKDKCSCE